MHGSVFLDGEGQVIRPPILWCDVRTAAQCRTITEKVGGRERLIELTGNPALEGFTAPKVVWLMEEEPDSVRAGPHHPAAQGLRALPPHGRAGHGSVGRGGYAPF